MTSERIEKEFKEIVFSKGIDYLFSLVPLHIKKRIVVCAKKENRSSRHIARIYHVSKSWVCTYCSKN